MFRHIALAGVLMMLLGSLATVGCAAAKKTIKAGPAAPVGGLDYAEDLAKIEHPRVVRLENGLTVLIKEDDRFPLVNVRLYVHAGSAYERPDQAGISHLLEHMVFKGTTERPAPGQIALEVESVGGSLNAGTSWDYTVYYVEVPDDEWSLGMDVVKDMAFHAKIAPEDLETERQVVLSEIQRANDTPSNLVFRTIQDTVWRDMSYQWPILGYPETVGGFTSQDIREYIGDHYQPQSMLLVVVGNVNADEVLAEARKVYGSLENTKAVTPPQAYPVPKKGDGPLVQVIPGKWNKVYLGLAFPIPDLYSNKSVGLEVLGQLMGGDDTSLLYRTFKYEKRLVDDISAFSFSLDRAGIFYVSATLDAENLAQFWDELMDTLAHLDPEKFTDQELERAKLNLADSLFQAKETLAGLAGKLGAFQFYYGGQHAEANYLFQLSHLDRQEMAELAKDYLRPDSLSACMLVPEGSAVDQEALARNAAGRWPAETGPAVEDMVQRDHEVREIELPGGSRLVLIPDDTLPYTALSIYWPGGDGELATDEQGLATLTAKVLTRGTENMTATQIEDFLSDRAALAAAAAGRDTFAFNAKFPAWYADDMLPVIRDMLTGPTWPLKEVDLAKQDQIANIKLREDKPLGLAFRHIFPFLYTSGPYSYFHRGTVEEIQTFTPGQIMSFWETQSAMPFVLAVCGQFDPEAIQAFAADLAGELTEPGRSYEFVAPAWSGDHDALLTLADRNQAHVLVVFPAAGTADLESSAGLTLMRAALAGQSGLLFRDLREEQGLGYTVTAFLWQAPRTGFLAFYIGTEPDKVDQAMAGFEAVTRQLSAEALPGEELERAKNILVGEYYQEHQTLLSRSRQAANLLALGLPRTMESELIDVAKELDGADLQALAKRYLKWDQAYVLKVLP